MTAAMRHPVIWMGVTGLLGVGVVGCGVTGHFAGIRTYHVRGKVKTPESGTAGIPTPSSNGIPDVSSTTSSSTGPSSTTSPASTSI